VQRPRCPFPVLREGDKPPTQVTGTAAQGLPPHVISVGKPTATSTAAGISARASVSPHRRIARAFLQSGARAGLRTGLRAGGSLSYEPLTNRLRIACEVQVVFGGLAARAEFASGSQPGGRSERLGTGRESVRGCSPVGPGPARRRRGCSRRDKSLPTRGLAPARPHEASSRSARLSGREAGWLMGCGWSGLPKEGCLALKSSAPASSIFRIS